MPYVDPDRKREYNKEYYSKNRCEIITQKRKYNSDNKDKINRYMRKYHHQNKDARLEYMKEWRLKNKESILSKSKIKNRNYVLLWKTFFKEYYGEFPSCQICGITLKWDGSKNEVVHWDHKNGKDRFRYPASIYTRSLNKENKQLWVGLDYGILCLVCNHRLPTENRLDWLNSALEYSTRK